MEKKPFKEAVEWLVIVAGVSAGVGIGVGSVVWGGGVSVAFAVAFPVDVVVVFIIKSLCH